MSVDSYGNHIIEETYKTLIHNVPHTDDNKAFYEESNSSNIHINASEIWMDYDKIPEDVNSCTFVDNLYTVNGIDIIEKKEHVKLTYKYGSRGNFYSADIKDALLKTNYKYQLTDANGEIIPFGLKRWHIDSYAGYVSFTEGFPTGYQEPFYIDFYKYVGRKASTEMLLKDGTISMDSEYSPVNDQDIATKNYIDQLIKTVKENYEKLTPPQPESLENKDLMLSGNSFSAYDVKTNVYYDKVFLNNETIKITLPLSWNPGVGCIRLRKIINNSDTIISVISCPNPQSNEIITVDYAGDYYADTLASRDFYKGIKLSVVISDLKEQMETSNGHNTITYYFEYAYNDTKYHTNYLTIGVESQPTENALSNQIILENSSITEKYISGVPTLSIGDVLLVKNIKNNTLHYFKKNSNKIYDINFLGKTYDGMPQNIYVNYSPTVVLNDEVIIPKNVTVDEVDVTVNSYNIFGENNGSETEKFYMHIDALSDESNRVNSNTLKSYNSSESLLNNNELQLEYGLYQWPIKNYQKNGDISYSNFNSLFISKGPNYSECSTDGERFVTLKYNLEYANGIWIEILNPKNMTQNTLTKAFDFNTMNIKVVDTDYSTGWLDALKSYDGIGINKSDGQGCLVIQKCLENKIYCTFGPKPIKGTLYIKCGIKYGNKQFGGFNIIKNI